MDMGKDAKFYGHHEPRPLPHPSSRIASINAKVKTSIRIYIRPHMAHCYRMGVYVEGTGVCVLKSN